MEWYLNAIEDGEQVDNETYLLEKKIIVEKVIDRLIYQVSIKFQPTYYYLLIT